MSLKRRPEQGFSAACRRRSNAACVTAALELTWEQVDLERGCITLRTREATTRKGRAVVPITSIARAALQPAREVALSDHVAEWAGGPVKSIRKGFAAPCRRARLTDVSPHVLRHTAACRMAAAGIPMEEIGQYLGHSGVRVTAPVHARYSPDHPRRSAEALEFPATRPPVQVQRTRERSAA